jgi:hypothetical protein
MKEAQQFPAAGLGRFVAADVVRRRIAAQAPLHGQKSEEQELLAFAVGFDPVRFAKDDNSTFGSV